VAASLGLTILVVLFALVYFAPRQRDSPPGVTPVSAANPTATPQVAEGVLPEPSRTSPPANTGTVSNLVARAVAATIHTTARRSPAGPSATPGPTDDGIVPTPSPSDIPVPTPEPTPTPTDIFPLPTPEPSPTDPIPTDPLPSISADPTISP
jgi:outer membrane biosynthesis protein TonB